MNIRTVTEGKRGCGYRQEGGLYLVTEGVGRYCGALPIPLEVCPTCHHGIKPSRGWTWIDLSALAAVRGCSREGGCGDCPIADAKIQKCGLLWIGEKFYKTPDDFSKEAQDMGVSRRISAVPRDFRIGETWVAFAHRHAIQGEFKLFRPDDKDHPTAIDYRAAIFHVVKPQRIEYVVRKSDSEKKLEDLEARGISLVRVIRKQEPAQKELITK